MYAEQFGDDKLIEIQSENNVETTFAKILEQLDPFYLKVEED